MTRFSHARPHHRFDIRRSLALLALLSVTLIPGAATASPRTAPRAEPDAPAAIVISVDTSADLNSGSNTQTCTYNSGAIFIAAGDGCTFRRALREAAGRPQSDRPIEIRFNLPNNDPNRNLEVNGTWTLPINSTHALPILDTFESPVNINGSVTIDGSTQPGGRSNGPKIIIDSGDRSLEIHSENNEIRNISYKGGGAIFLHEGGNTVENIWMGLTDNGQAIAFREPGNEFRMAGGGIFIRSDDNTIQNNVVSGAFAKAIDIDSGNSNNVIQNNNIGTRADGTVPTVSAALLCQRSLTYNNQNWYGGWGIAISGSNNRVIGNRIAGLHILQSANDTPPRAIEAFGGDHEISDNIIGLDADGKKVGVCGQGIKVSDGPTVLLDNTIVRSRADSEDAVPTAIFFVDSTPPAIGEIAVRRNLVEDGPGAIYQFGPKIPTFLSTFNPAKITSIDGVTVRGANGDGSPCPGCLIDFYLDDTDDIAEALEHLGTVSAANNGTFVFTMSQPLPEGRTIRTASTTQSAGVIGSLGSGATTKFSQYYLSISEVTIDGPDEGETGSEYEFTFAITPAEASAPFNWSVDATDFDTRTNNGTDSSAVVTQYTWTTPGVKTVDVTVQSGLGTVTATFQITIASDRVLVFLPFVSKLESTD